MELHYIIRLRGLLKSNVSVGRTYIASEQLKPGQKVVFSCYDFNRKTVNHGGLYLKVKAYKNGKLIAVSYDDHYMIYMPPGYHY